MKKKVIIITTLFIIFTLLLGIIAIYYIEKSEKYVFTIKEISDNSIYVENQVIDEYTYPSNTEQKFKTTNGNYLNILDLKESDTIIDEYTNYIYTVEKIENTTNNIIITFSYSELYYFYIDNIIVKDEKGNQIDKSSLKANDVILVTTRKYNNQSTVLHIYFQMPRTYIPPIKRV